MALLRDRLQDPYLGSQLAPGARLGFLWLILWAIPWAIPCGEHPRCCR